jgi:ATP-dependent helicase/nuclease subunit B
VRVVFGIDFDHGFWPGPLADREAVAGEIWVGPLGFLGLLETALGTGGPPTSELLRVARIVPAVRRLEGFWSTSADLDALTVARTLLGWRDRLWLQGWRGEAHTGRLGQLAQVTAEATDGIPDRIVATTEALAARSVDLGEIELCEPLDGFPPLWRRLFEALEGCGCRVSSRELEVAEAHGDLLAAREGRLVPEKDGSLQLLRPYGVLEAAEETAAWLAALPSLDGTVVIGGDAILDSALCRFGLPTTGGSEAGGGDSVLGVLPLVLRLGWDPPRPQAALDLLNLPVSPVPGRIARRLRRALVNWPAVGSEAWDAALAEGLAEIEDEGYRQSVTSRLAILMKMRARRREDMPAAEIHRRVEAVAEWLRARRAAQEAGEEPHGKPADWGAALEQCRLVLSVLDAMGLEGLAPPELDGLAAEATAAVGSSRRFSAEAGLAAVGCPGALVGPARRVVWWGFDSDSAPTITRWPASLEARRALAAHGVELPELGLEAEAKAERWRRPLLAAERSLVLVCPHHGEDGREQYPHPLWDEIVGGNDYEKVRQLAVGRPIAEREPPKRPVAPRAAPAPRRSWQTLPELLPRREVESPSSLGSLLGCSLQWALNYHAKLRPDHSFALPSPARTRGSLLHEVLERVLVDGTESPEEAETRAAELFEELGPRLDARLFLPGAEEERAELRLIAGKSARRLHEVLRSAGRRVLKTEEWLTSPAFGTRVGGRLDLVLGDPPAVIDLKLGSGNWRRRALENGVLEDLAVYGHLLRADEQSAFPPVGYFILNEQALLTNAAGGFGTGEKIGGPRLEEVWKGLRAAVRGRFAELAKGIVEAPANSGENDEDPPKESALVDGRLVKEPPCKFCDFAALCGLSFAGEGGGS